MQIFCLLTFEQSSRSNQSEQLQRAIATAASAGAGYAMHAYLFKFSARDLLQGWLSGENSDIYYRTLGASFNQCECLSNVLQAFCRDRQAPSGNLSANCLALFARLMENLLNMHKGIKSNRFWIKMRFHSTLHAHEHALVLHIHGLP